MNKNYVIAATITISVAIAIPMAIALGKSENMLKIERSNNHQLQLNIDTVEKQKKDRETELQKELELRNQQLNTKDQEIEKLNKDLQARAESKRLATVASTPADGAGVSASTNCEDYRGLVAKYFPASQVDNALLTMKKESGCRSNAVSATQDFGLMQINQVHLPAVGGSVQALFDPETNIKIGADVWRGRQAQTGNGWRAWYAVAGLLW